MTAALLRSGTPVTLVGGGPVRAPDLTEALAKAPRLVAVDGGADRALALGAIPDLVVGDMDSISDTARAAVPATARHTISEQDTTDFEKCLSRIRAPLVLALGVSGRRLDHTLAALTVLARCAVQPCIVIGRRDVVCLVPPRMALALPDKTRVSLYPLAPVTGTSTGLHWPIDGLELSPLDRIGTSNRAVGPVTLTATRPALVLLLPRRCLGAMTTALSAAPGWG